MTKTLTLNPKLSEKTYNLSEARVYAVVVPSSANKHEIAKAIKDQFEVEVDSVRISVIKGKTKRTMSLNGKRFANKIGQRNDIKKAYITLKSGHSLPFFNAIEEEEQKEQSAQAKIDKTLDKQAAKEAKKETKPKRRGFRLKKKTNEEEQ